MIIIAIVISIILFILLTIIVINVVYRKIKGGSDAITKFITKTQLNNIIVHHPSDNEYYKNWIKDNKVDVVRQELYVILRVCQLFEYKKFKELTPIEAINLRAKYENTNFVYSYRHKIEKYVKNIIYSLSMKNLIEMVFINNGIDKPLSLNNGDKTIDNIIQKWGNKVMNETYNHTDEYENDKNVFTIVANFYYNLNKSTKTKEAINNLWEILKFKNNVWTIMGGDYILEYNNNVFYLNQVNSDGDGMLFLNNCLVTVNFDEHSNEYTYYFENMRGPFPNHSCG